VNVYNQDKIHDLAVKTLDLHKKRFALTNRVPLFFLDSISVEAQLDRSIGALVVAMWSGIYAATKTTDVSVTVPATWLDHFKLRWFPMWLICKYPVKYRELVYKVDVDALFPELVGEREHQRIMYRVCNRGFAK